MVESIPGVPQDDQFESILDASYNYCWEIMAFHSKSFSFANKYLNDEERFGVAAFYAFARYVDNLVDDKELPMWVINKKLDHIKVQLDNLTNFDKEENIIYYALDDTIRKYNIPIQYLHDLIEGVRMDLTITEFVSIEQLDLYCYRVASVVGIVSCHIFGVTNPVALGHASELGKAMQITNILRDIKEDFLRGRIYLSKDIRNKFNLNIEELAENHVSQNLRDLIKHEIWRAREFYKIGTHGYQYLPNRALFTVKLAADVYSGILDEIEKNDYQILDRRVYVKKAKKLRIASKLRIFHFFNTLPYIGRKELKN